MFSLISPYPIGIDIGNKNVYAVQLRQVKGNFVVMGLVHRRLEAELDGHPKVSDLLVPALQEISRDRRFKGRRAVIHFLSKDIVHFPIRFRVGKTETVEEVILRESKDYLPFPLDEALLDYPSIHQSTSEAPDRYKAHIIAARRDFIDQYLQIFKKAGLTVEVIDFGVSSLMRLHNHLFDMTDNPVVLGHMGQTRTMVSVVTRDQILAYRTIPWGVEILFKKIFDSLELPNEEERALILLRQYGLYYELRETGRMEKASTGDELSDQMSRVVYQIITPHVEELIYEFHKIIGYVRSEEHGAEFKGIYMYGHANTIHSLDRYLENRLDIPTTIVNPMTKMGLSDKKVLPDLPLGAPFDIALGLAMRRVPWL